jgi:Patatin-like phospholipase
VVSGVSAGALAAPFAFLGSAYDGALQDIFTKLSAGQLYSGSGISGIFGQSLYDTAPLEKLIRHYATDDFLDKIAAEHRKGRRLLIMTTDLDSERPVIWYLSAIAASSRPDRRDLFVKILLASSAVPGLFPPVEIPVLAADGKTYDELHVDGGVTAELVFVPPEMKLPQIEDRVFGKARSRDLYVIRNGKLVPEYHASRLRAVSLASRAVATMVKYQVVADLRTLDADSKATGTKFYFNATPPSFDAADRKPFDPAYAQRLYAVGRRVGLAGTWSTTVPMSPELVPH